MNKLNNNRIVQSLLSKEDSSEIQWIFSREILRSTRKALEKKKKVILCVVKEHLCAILMGQVIASNLTITFFQSIGLD